MPKPNRSKIRFVLSVFLLCSAVSLFAQPSVAQPTTAQPSADRIVPSLVKYNGTLSGADAKPLTGTQGVMFLLYKDETGGAPLWMETQNVQADKNGRFSVMLGAANAQGLPSDVFVNGEARWLAVQVSGQAEQSRTLLVSVPYALKAGDAETLGGRPASAFMAAAGSGTSQSSPLGGQVTYDIVCASASACKTGFVPVFSTTGGSSSVTSSLLTQSGSTIKIAGSESATGNIAAGGNVSATGNVTAAGNLSGLNVSVPGTVAAGFMSTNSYSNGLTSTMTGPASGIGAVQGFATATGASGFTFGVIGQSASDQGRGVFGLSTGTGGVGVIGENNSTGIGVVGKSLSGQGLAFAATGNVQQDRTSGGWAKAMLFVNTYSAPYTIVRCFNSQLTGAAATTPPCGFNLTELGPGIFNIDFGFEVDDRFINATVYNDFSVPVIYPSGTTAQIFWYNARTQQWATGEYYWLTVY